MKYKLTTVLMAIACSLSPKPRPLCLPYPDHTYTQVGLARKTDNDALFLIYKDIHFGHEKCIHLTSGTITFCNFLGWPDMSMCRDLREANIYIDEDNICTAFLPAEMSYDLLLQFLKYAALSVSPKYSQNCFPEHCVIHTGADIHLRDGDPKRMIQIPRSPTRIGISTFNPRKCFMVNVHIRDGFVRALSTWMSEVLPRETLTVKLIQAIEFVKADKINRFTAKVDGKLINFDRKHPIFLDGNKIDIYLDRS